MDGLAYQVVFHTCGTRIEWKQRTISCIPRDVGVRRLEIYRILSSACFPGLSFSMIHVADMLFNHATNVSNLLPSSQSLIQRFRSCPAVTVRFLGGPLQKLMRYSPCIQVCEPPSSQLRIPLPWFCSLCLFERLVMLITLRFPRSHQIPCS